MSKREMEENTCQNSSTELCESLKTLIILEKNYVSAFKPGKFHRAINHLPQFLLARNVYAIINGRNNPRAATIFVVLLSHIIWHILFVMALSRILVGPDSYQFKPKFQLITLLTMLVIAMKRAEKKGESEEQRVKAIGKIISIRNDITKEIEENNLQTTDDYNGIYQSLKANVFISHDGINVDKEKPDNNWSCAQRFMNITPSEFSKPIFVNKSQKNQVLPNHLSHRH